MTNAMLAKYAVNAWSTPHNSALEDIEQIARTGGAGVGLWEGKLQDGEDAAVLAAMQDAGLRATYCVPRLHTIHPVFFNPPGVPTDPRERTKRICESIPRLAAFEPLAIICGPGSSGDADHPASSDYLHEGVAQIADVAAEHGVQVAWELLSRRRGSPQPSLPGIVEFLDEVGRANVGVFFDTFHTYAEPDIHQDLQRFARRINGVHVNDVRRDERSAFDRLLPGQGLHVAPGLMASLMAGGYDGWWELELFSDDGTFFDAFPDSLWAIPHEEMLRRGAAAFGDTYTEAVRIAASLRSDSTTRPTSR